MLSGVEVMNAKGVLPGRICMTLEYDVAQRLYEYVKKEVESRRDYYEYAKIGGVTPAPVVESLRKDLEAFEPLYIGYVAAYQNRVEVE